MVTLQIGVTVQFGFCRTIRVPVSMLAKMPKDWEALAAMQDGKLKVRGLTYECLGDGPELVSEHLADVEVRDTEGNLFEWPEAPGPKQVREEKNEHQPACLCSRRSYVAPCHSNGYLLSLVALSHGFGRLVLGDNRIGH